MNVSAYYTTYCNIPASRRRNATSPRFLRGFHFRFFASLRSSDDFGFGPFAGKSEANPPAFGAMPQHLPVVEYFIPFRL